MGWERRKRGNRYYTRSKKIDGRVVREYLGCGPAAAQAAEEDTARRTEQEATRARRQELAMVEDHVAALEALVDAQITVHLVLHGYCKHHRGEWRKMRKGNDDRTDEDQ